MSNIQIDLSGLPQLTNDVYYPLYADRSRYLVLKGGGGSGKSVFATQKLLYRLLTEPKHRFLVVRKVAQTLRDSVFAELVHTIDAWGLRKLFKIPTGRSSDLYIRCLNGGEILFAGLDDVEKLKSIQGVTSIWIEEASELDVTDFRQLDIRLRSRSDVYKQIMFTFNPIDVNHWLKKEFFDAPKQGAKTVETTYKDNRFLDAEAIRVLLSFRDLDPYYYQVYALGEWGVLGKTIFPAAVVNERISQLRRKKPLRIGYFVYEYTNDRIRDDSIKFIDDESGYIRIYAEPDKHTPYALGGDTAGEGSDYFAAQVGDNVTQEQVAVLHHPFDEDLYTRQVYCLGRYYHNALVGVETNFSTFPVKELERLGYLNQYTREVEDTYTGATQKRYGFRTDKLTRPLIIAGLVKIVREHPEWFHDIPTLEEMLTFVRNERGRPEAQQGAHDDLLMAEAIRHYVAKQQDSAPYEDYREPPKKLADKLGINKHKMATVRGGMRVGV